MLANENPAMKHANQTATKFYTNKEERRFYEAAERYRHDRATLLDEGFQEGKAEGRLEGIAEGRLEGIAEGLATGKTEGLSEAKLLIAREMLTNGFDVDIIMKLTKLSRDEILNI